MEFFNKINTLGVDKFKSEIKDCILASNKTMDIGQLSENDRNGLSTLLSELGYKDYYSNELCSWPVFLDDFVEKNTIEKSEIDINTCAVAFGAMALSKVFFEYSNKSKDSRYLYKKILNGKETKEIRNTRRILINSLITLLWLRNHDKSWPVSKKINDNNSIYDGTINQTTVAISALLNLGFLDEKCPLKLINNSNEILQKRSIWLLDSISWLESCGIRNDDNSVGWDYSIKSDECSTEAALLPTEFVFETTLKVVKKINSINIDLNEKHEKMLSDICVSAIKWLKNSQCYDSNNDGGFSKNSGNQPSIIHTCFAINGFSEKTKFYEEYSSKLNENSDIDTAAAEIANTPNVDETDYIISTALNYLLNNKEILNYSLIMPETFVDSYKTYIYNNHDKKNPECKIDHHETFIEAIIILTMCNCIRKFSNYRMSYKRTKILKIISYAYKMLKNRGKLVNNYRVYRSRHIELDKKYPIYCMYYSILALNRLKEIEKDLARYDRRIVRQYFRGFLTLLVCALFNYLLTGVNPFYGGIISTALLASVTIYAQRLFYNEHL